MLPESGRCPGQALCDAVVARRQGALWQHGGARVLSLPYLRRCHGVATSLDYQNATLKIVSGRLGSPSGRSGRLRRVIAKSPGQMVGGAAGDAATPVAGVAGEVPLTETFEGRSQLFASYHMWRHTGLPAAGQCEGCTFNTGHVLELSYLHSRGVTDGEQLRDARHDRLRPPGAVGGLSRGLAVSSRGTSFSE
jgi:Bacterial protein of unknown function (DUF899)